LALPQHEFGLDVLALVGRLRHAEHRSVPDIHRELTRPGVAVALRSVGNLLDRSDELRALATADRQRLHALLRKQRRVISVEAWRRLRADLDKRRESRRKQRCFRRDPDGYLRQLEERCHARSLPTWVFSFCSLTVDTVSPTLILQHGIRVSSFVAQWPTHKLREKEGRRRHKVQK
jgi:hypothetical protein